MAISTSGATPVTLRRWRERDLPALVAAHQDPAMDRWLVNHIRDEQDARDWYEWQQRDWEDGVRFVFAVVDPDQPNQPGQPDQPDQPNQPEAAASDPVGLVGIRRPDPQGSTTEVGYWTVARVRGRGIAPRALDAAVAWLREHTAQTEHPVKRVELIHSLGNEASCRVAEKAGFALEQELPPHLPKWTEPGHLHVRLL